jgi:hypothetical protein
LIDVGQDFADHLDRRAARLLDHGDIEVALLVGLHFGFADRFEPGGFEESGDGVVRRADARAFLLLAHVGLARRHAVHGKREPPRRHERLGAVIDEAGIDQPVGHELAQILRRPRLHARGNFFGEKLEQEIGHRIFLQPLMAAVAHRLFRRAFAGAEPDLLGRHFRLEFDRRESRYLVRAVAERLLL